MMDLLLDYLLALFAFFVAFAVIVGAIVGWPLIFLLFRREREFARARRSAELAALDAAAHPIVGHREAA